MDWDWSSRSSISAVTMSVGAVLRCGTLVLISLSFAKQSQGAVDPSSAKIHFDKSGLEDIVYRSNVFDRSKVIATLPKTLFNVNREIEQKHALQIQVGFMHTD